MTIVLVVQLELGSPAISQPYEAFQRHVETVFDEHVCWPLGASAYPRKLFC